MIGKFAAIIIALYCTVKRNKDASISRQQGCLVKLDNSQRWINFIRNHDNDDDDDEDDDDDDNDGDNDRIESTEIMTTI